MLPNVLQSVTVGSRPYAREALSLPMLKLIIYKITQMIMNQTKNVVGGGKALYEAPALELLEMSFGSKAICTSVLAAEMNLALVDDGTVESLSW